MIGQTLTWNKVTINTLLAIVASWLFDLLLLVLRIRLQPNNLVDPNFLFFLVWLFPLVLFIKYFLARPTGKRNSLLLLFVVSTLLLCANLRAIGPTFAEISACSTQYSGFRVSYKCTCTTYSTETVGLSESHECEYTGIRFIPIVQEK